MKIIDFGASITEEVCLCLGQFDSIHKGHRKIIKMAQSFGKKVCVFAFKSEVTTPQKTEGVVFSTFERLEIFENLGVDYLILCDFEDVKDETKEEFIQILQESINIFKIVCGEDYRFGKGGSGDIEYLKSLFGGKLYVCEKVLHNGEKASTNQAKEYIKTGEIKSLNELLECEYFVKGFCEKGFQNGTKLGFPTANIRPAEGKVLLKEGVYIGKTKIKGEIYKSMINVGKIPTFGGEEYKVETHAVGINQPLYGEEITVYFERFLRDAVKFSGVEALKAQLKKDVEEIR